MSACGFVTCRVPDSSFSGKCAKKPALSTTTLSMNITFAVEPSICRKSFSPGDMVAAVGFFALADTFDCFCAETHKMLVSNRRNKSVLFIFNVQLWMPQPLPGQANVNSGQQLGCHVGSSPSPVAHGENYGGTASHDVAASKQTRTRRLHTFVYGNCVFASEFETIH